MRWYEVQHAPADNTVYPPPGPPIPWNTLLLCASRLGPSLYNLVCDVLNIYSLRHEQREFDLFPAKSEYHHKKGLLELYHLWGHFTFSPLRVWWVSGEV